MTRGADAMPDLELGLIGNCQISALVDTQGTIVWGCFPRLDGEPVFSHLIDDGNDRGRFAIELQDQTSSRQYYLRNTPILCTELHDRHGGALRITDFAPRFAQYGRRFRPVMLVRHVEVMSGTPVARIRLRPTAGYGADTHTVTQGSNHVRFVFDDQVLRLTTDAPVTSILQEQAQVLERDVTLILGPDESVTESVAEMGRRFFDETRTYWHEWVRSLAVPFDWQSAVIRAAITLKLSTFDDTGAVVAAMTTSIPEVADSGRNWDYRYCWLRDAYFVVHALNRLGATGTLERYLRYIINLVAGSDDALLQPLYGIGGETTLTESEADHLGGYRGMKPVRIGNDAYRQIQHDSYGAVVLAVTQAFFDERLTRPGDVALFRRLEPLGEHAARLFDQPDAGLWEYRGHEKVHTYSAVMCWAACDRLARIADRLELPDAHDAWRRRAGDMHAVISEQGWSERRGAFVESFGGERLDASLLLLHELDFVAADDPRFVATVEAIEGELRRGDHMFRYIGDDDFGTPENAFNICTFWYIDALAAIGRGAEARRLFENMLASTTRLGLLSEDMDPTTGELWGNFPQTYSMVGLINSALALSRRWEDAF
ncbi:glycoside hydrolase family 15 protein [Halofilum ochraceum]|uniref:glycoside hydrolase family 15 protein n=1 Tax=Halofilum ochraceum TaxID=1611323 RepID=UPI0009F2CC52|nr:glycoside hydrolase family 15 protein [Halofilum ochraceum]